MSGCGGLDGWRRGNEIKQIRICDNAVGIKKKGVSG